MTKAAYLMITYLNYRLIKYNTQLSWHDHISININCMLPLVEYSEVP